MACRACRQALLWRVLIIETGQVTERLRVREIDDDEGQQLVRIIRRGSGSVVTWRRAQMVLLARRRGWLTFSHWHPSLSRRF